MVDSRQKNVNMVLGFIGPIGLFVALAALVVLALKGTPKMSALNISMWIVFGIGIATAIVGAGSFIYYFSRQSYGKRIMASFVAKSMIILGIVVAVFVNYIATKHNRTWDLTSAKMYTISDATKERISNLGLKKTVEDRTPCIKLVHIYYDTDDTYSLIQKYLQQYKAYNPDYVILESINPDRNMESKASFTDFISEKEDEKVIVIRGNYDGRNYNWSETRTTEILASEMYSTSRYGGGDSFIGESKLTEAIVKLTTDNPCRIGYTDRNQEIAFDSRDAQGLGEFKIEMEKEAKDIEAIDINDPIDSGLSLVIVPFPTTPFSPQALKNLDDFLFNGGSVMVLTNGFSGEDAVDDFPLNPWLKKMGVIVQPGIVYEDTSRVFRDGTAGITNFSNHDIVQKLSDSSTPVVRTLYPKRLEIRKDLPEGIKVQELLTSSDFSYWIKDVKNKDDNEQTSSHVALAVEGRLGDSSQDFKMVVVGDSRIACNQFLKSRGANKDFMLNSVNWLVGEENDLNIRPKSPDEFHFTLTPQKLRAIGLLILLGLPLLCMFAGLSVWLLRRK